METFRLFGELNIEDLNKQGFPGFVPRDQTTWSLVDTTNFDEPVEVAVHIGVNVHEDTNVIVECDAVELAIIGEWNTHQLPLVLAKLLVDHTPHSLLAVCSIIYRLSYLFSSVEEGRAGTPVQQALLAVPDSDPH